MSTLFDLTGKTAIVTGSTKGIGRAIARALAQHGARVVVSSRDTGRVEATQRELLEEGLDVIGLPCNVGRKAELQGLIDETLKAWGQIDIAVGNAAINPHYGPAMEVADETFAKIMATNVQSNLWLAQMVADGMRRRKDGAIIYVSSIGGFFGTDVIGAYGISKAADFQLARNLAVELGSDNIRVNCIAPGLVRTDFARKLWDDPERAAQRIAETPLRRLGEPDDIAGIAVYLASGAGSWTTGQTFVVDGGVSIMGRSVERSANKDL
jgi:NAD(P)-dependent dehydrogenase (short-subunit alcohol dehydrogenase family)